MFQNHEVIVFAIEHYNSLDIIRSLGEKGIYPIYIAVKGKVPLASKSKYVSKVHYVDTVPMGYQVLISEYGKMRSARKPLLYCTDDKTMGYLDERYDELKDKFIMFNAGVQGGINKYINKWRILKLAEECGLETAKTVLTDNGNIPDDIEFPVITKSISPNVGGWKSDVFICRTKEELRMAYTKIQAPQVLLQRYIEKKNELEYYGFSIDHGNQILISIGADYLYQIPGYYSPYMNIFNPPYPCIQDKVKSMIRKIGFEGIFSCEFIVDQDDRLYFLEINFRNATWSYASTVAGMNLPYLWAESTLQGRIPERAGKGFDTFRAMVEPIDFGKRVDTGKISFAEWLGDFKEARCTYYYNEQDPEPFEVLRDHWDTLK